MTRSLWKGPFVHPSRFRAAPSPRVWSRASAILPQFVGSTVRVHNGAAFVTLEIKEAMIGHKLGEFALTRKRPVHKKKEKKR